MTETIRLDLPSRIEAVAEAANAVAKIVNRLGFGEEAVFAIDVSVREAVINAVLHGNKRDESKTVEVAFKSRPDALEIEVRDQGQGFDAAEVPDPTLPENIMKTSGRGLFLIRNFMDEVEWFRNPGGGSIVRMVKRL